MYVYMNNPNEVMWSLTGSACYDEIHHARVTNLKLASRLISLQGRD